MKRKGNIYEEICKVENVKKAILKATNRKKYRIEVQEVYNNIDFYTLELQKMLLNKTYMPSEYIEKKIYDGARQKERIIYKPKFYPDQCVHWCLMLNIERLLARGMYDYSCACVKNRGILYGVKYIKKILVRDRKNTKYCLKLDIKKYYPSVNKEMLKRKFMRIIKDRDVLDLVDLIINSSKQGLPIRQLYFTMVCKFLFAGFRSLYKGRIESSLLCQIYG